MSHEVIQRQNRRLIMGLVLVMMLLFLAAMSLMVYR
jgi:hypothetical protein